MPTTLDISCPNCGKPLKVPAELAGKRVKCKGCDEVFPVPAPKAAAKPAAKPGPAAKAPPKAAPLPPPPKPKRPFLDDDEDDGQAPKPIPVVHEDDAPRCPHCAKDLDPPDAVVCTNCGYNNVTRVQAESKRVYAATAGDWVAHLGPGVVALLLAAGLIGGTIFAGVNMREWMEGSFLEMEEKDLAGRKKMLLPPGAFIALIGVFAALIAIPSLRFAFRRLVLNPKPPEKVKG
jgi:hypothetical protein